MRKYFFLIFLLFTYGVNAEANTIIENKINAYFSALKKKPTELYQFLYHMPKGGDLHSHFGGAVYAENLISFSQQDPYCLKNYQVINKMNCQTGEKISQVKINTPLYNNLIDAWSMNRFIPGKETQAKHFFETFSKFSILVTQHPSEVLSEILNRAGKQNISYVELMLTAHNLNFMNAKGEVTAAIGKKVGWDNNLLRLREKMLNQGLAKIIAQIPYRITQIEKGMRKQQKCSSKHHASPGCHVMVRYQYTALRGLPPSEFFAQVLTAFEAAKLDKRIVGINIVQAEDGPIAIRDYPLHMKILNTLHKLYPTVNISLHAGELAEDMVSPEALRFHIRQAIEIGQAQRIGHGTDITYEDNSLDLLKEMAKKQVMVEINLTSNDSILGIRGIKHPFPLYLKYGVPVALSTDDEGVLRTHITQEYLRAVHDYQLPYPLLKMLARNSLTYSFLPGKNLWLNANSQKQVTACANDPLGSAKLTKSCTNFLSESPKARLQWQLENKFQHFEKEMLRKLAAK